MKCFKIHILVIFIINLIDVQGQITKFDKWKDPGYFKGFNMSVWDNNEMREVNQNDFNSLKEIGASLVVIQTQGSRTVDAPYGPNIYYQEGNLIILHIEMLDQMAEYARNAGLYYVIAVRDGPGRLDVSMDGVSTIWQNSEEQQIYGQMLREMAERYIGDSLFVGMSLTVEPNPLGELWEPPVDVLDSALKANSIDINRLYSIWIDSIRTIDAELPIIVGGVHANHPEYFSLITKQTDNKVIYTTHLYNPANFSHSDIPYNENYPGFYWCVRLDAQVYLNRESLQNEMYKPVVDFQNQYEVPIFIGEFGIRVPQNGGEMYLKDIASIACDLGWHYAIWGFNNGPEFNYKDLDSIYGTNYWMVVQELMDCATISVKEIAENSKGIYAYPNPFSESTNINYELQTADRVRIEIFNPRGEKITTLVDEWQQAGRHSTTFSVGTIHELPLQSGMYFYRIQIGDKIMSGKIIHY